jgi:hypothetical protein
LITKELANGAPPQFVLQHALEAYRLEHMEAPDLDERRRRWQTLRNTVAKIGTDPSASRSLKVKAHLVRLYADTLEAGTEYTQHVSGILMQLEISGQTVTPDMLAEIQEAADPTTRLLAEAEELLRDAADQEHPLLLAEAFVNKAVVLISREVDKRYLMARLKLAVPPLSEHMTKHLRDCLEHAIRIFAKAGSLELELWAKLYLADTLELTGDLDGSRKIGEAVYTPSMAMNYQRNALRAKEHLSGDTEYQRMLAYLRSDKDPDPDMASATDDRVRQKARRALTMLRLPEDRLPFLEQSWFATRGMAQERFQWCRHLDMEEDRRPQYTCDHDRRCICKKFGHASRILSPDWKALVAGFKQVYCAPCDAKEPKPMPSAG